MARTIIGDEAVDPMNRKRLKVHDRLRSTGRSGIANNAATSSTADSQRSKASSSSINAPAASNLAQRYALIHLLALRPLPRSAIQTQTGIPAESLSKLLDLVADKSRVDSELTWTLTTKRYKDLDPWAFPYADDDRRNVVNNAIRAFDKMRYDAHDQIWQFLLSPSERGKGKTLSKLNLFPNDHRRLLSGIDNQSKSRPGSPAHPHSAEQSDAESVASTRKQTKKPDIIANAKKRLAGYHKVDKPVKQDKPADKKKGETQDSGKSKKVNGHSASVDMNNKRGKVLSDELVHSSDDESLEPSTAPKPEDNVHTRPDQAGSTPALPAKSASGNQASPSSKTKPNSLASKKRSDDQADATSSGSKVTGFARDNKESKAAPPRAPGTTAKRQAEGSIKEASPAKKAKAIEPTPEKLKPEATAPTSNSSKRPKTETLEKEAPPPKKTKPNLPMSEQGRASIASQRAVVGSIKSEFETSKPNHVVKPQPKAAARTEPSKDELKPSLKPSPGNPKSSESETKSSSTKREPLESEVKPSHSKPKPAGSELKPSVATLKSTDSELKPHIAKPKPASKETKLTPQKQATMESSSKSNSSNTTPSKTAPTRKDASINTNTEGPIASADTKHSAPKRPVFTSPTASDEAPSRRQTFNLYRQYHKYFKQYSTNMTELKRRTDKTTHEDLDRVSSQFDALQSRQYTLIKGFVAMLDEAKRELSANPDEVVTLDDKADNGRVLSILDEKAVGEAREKLKERWKKWQGRYADFTKSLGAWSPEDVEGLWSELDLIRERQRRISRSAALEHGKKKEGNLKDAGLE